MNLENLKRIIDKKATTLPLLRNIDCRTEKNNEVLPYISTKKITEINELIYAGAKLVCEKSGFP